MGGGEEKKTATKELIVEGEIASAKGRERKLDKGEGERLWRGMENKD